MQSKTLNVCISDSHKQHNQHQKHKQHRNQNKQDLTRNVNYSSLSNSKASQSINGCSKTLFRKSKPSLTTSSAFTSRMVISSNLDQIVRDQQPPSSANQHPVVDSSVVISRNQHPAVDFSANQHPVVHFSVVISRNPLAAVDSSVVISRNQHPAVDSSVVISCNPLAAVDSSASQHLVVHS